MIKKFHSYIIKEEEISLLPYMKYRDFSYTNDPYVYKNPPSIKKFVPRARAISDINGDLYVLDNFDLLHDDLIDYLVLNNKIDNRAGYNMKIHQYDYCVAWERYGASNTFLLNDQYDRFEKLSSYLQNMILLFHKKVSEKNTQFNFITKNIHEIEQQEK